MLKWKWMAIWIACGCCLQVHAQDEKQDATGDKAQYEVGFHVGNLLPNQIDGLTEIIGLGGVRLGYKLAPLTYAEAGLIMGNGAGAQWKDTHIDARMDIPIENLVALAYVGADMVYYSGVNTASRIIFGANAGGGMQMQISGGVWFRADMKFSISPGTSLYIGAGITYRY